MTNASELSKQMDDLEEEARHIISNPSVSNFELRQTIERLLRLYRVLDDYQRALAAYIRGMAAIQQGQAADPEALIREILASPEFSGLRLPVLATLIAAIYGGGPRSGWVPWTLLPVVTVAGLGL